MSPTKKKTPAPKKSTAKKPAPKAVAAKPSKPSKKPAKAEKPVAKKAAAKAAPAAAPKKAAAPAPPARSPEKKAPSKPPDAAAIAKAAAARPVPPAKPTAVKTVPAKGVDAKTAVKAEVPAKGKPAPGKKGVEEPGATTKRAKPRKPVTPTGPRHPKLGFRWACYGCGAKFYDLGKDEPLCPKCGADQRDRPADEPKQHSTDHARPRVVRPMAQLLDDDEPATPHVEDDLALDEVAGAGDMFEGDGDIDPLEIDGAELASDTIEAGEPDEF